MSITVGGAFVEGAGTQPTGNAGGDLGTTYPNPTVVSVANVTTGTLAVANGGTGKTTLTAHGVLLGEGTSAVAITSAGTAGQALVSGGASADPAFAAVSLAGGSGVVSGVLPNANTTAASANTASAIVTRDGSGNFAAGVVTMNGLPKFAGTNSTGAGTALLSTNCPAVTATAPYTWISATAADGSTVFIPAWK